MKDNTLSRWCELLAPDGMEIVEYLDELKQWWKKSYGHELNYKIACPLLADMFARMDSVLAGMWAGISHALDFYA